jgi:acetyl esterase/lipase
LELFYSLEIGARCILEEARTLSLTSSRMRIAILVLVAITGALAQDPTFPTHTIPLWETHAPGALADEERDRPTLTLYPTFRQTIGTAVIIAPGGSYEGLALNLEGRQVANWFNALGVTAFLLKYRLGPRYHHPIELGDAQRAIRLVRTRAREFGVKPDRIGIIGFSAGGHLASTAGTHFDGGDPNANDAIERASCRPDFLMLAYPVISMSERYTDELSKRNLLGESPEPKLVQALSNEIQVTPHTPPTFLFHGGADADVAPENSVLFYLALRQARVPAELHIFSKGEHGVGLAFNDPALAEWPELLRDWLRGLGLLTR